MRGQALSAQIAGDLVSLSSQRSNITAPPAIQTQFPNWQALIPRPTCDQDFHRFAAAPTLIALAASLCKAIGGHMTFTAADNSSPIRIDCTSLSLKFHQPPRAVIAAMPVFSKWDNPTAIDLHPDTTDDQDDATAEKS